MKPAAVCPVVPAAVDAAAGRLAALLVVLAVSASLALASGWAFLALSADFALRAFSPAGWSPLGRAAALLRRGLGLAPRRVNAGPKRFAAGLGCLMAGLAGLAFLAGLPSLGLALGGLLALCAALEGALGLCVACALYPWVARMAPARG